MAAGLSLQYPLPFASGLLGNIISFMVYLAPIPTFYRIYRKKSTEGFQSVPYVVSLFSAMLWIYYALVKTNTLLLITINSFGCLIQIIYISVYLFYAPKKARWFTIQIFSLLNLVIFGLLVLLTQLLCEGSKRVEILGWICVAFSVSVFAAPLSIIRLVVRTKSVEFMPFWLSFFLTLSAIAWFSFGLFSKDLYIMLPNILGFTFGMLQMILYMVYKKKGSYVNSVSLPEVVVSVVAVNPAPEVVHNAAIKIEIDDVDNTKKNKENCRGNKLGNDEHDHVIELSPRH